METKPTAMVNKSKTAKEVFKIYGTGSIIGLIILVVAYQFVAPAPPKTFTIATAGVDGAYYAFAEKYRKYFLEENIDLQIIDTTGSVENLKLLTEKKVEVAFVQSGIGRSEDFPALEGLASLYLEPLWIFTRKGFEVTDIADLAGKRISIGPDGSGTRSIALQLLADNNLSTNKPIEIFPYSSQEGAGKLLSGQIDALFIVSTENSFLVQKLFNDPRIDLASLKRAESYTRLHHYLSHVVLPEGVLDMENNIPDRSLHFIAPAATLVINEELHPALIDLLMQVVAKVHRDEGILTAGNTFPSPTKLDFPLNKEAKRFYRNGTPFLQRYLPFWAASLIDRMKVMLLPLIALILPLMKVLPPTYRWRMRSRIYRWYEELHELDQHTRENVSDDVIIGAISSLNDMEHDVIQVEVPLSYAQELYNLRLHIDLLRKQLNQLRTE